MATRGLYSFEREIKGNLRMTAATTTSSRIVLMGFARTVVSGTSVTFLLRQDRTSSVGNAIAYTKGI